MGLTVFGDKIGGWKNSALAKFFLPAWLVFAATLVFNATPALAEEKKAMCDADCVAVGKWQFDLGVGAGIRLNPLVDGEDTPLVLLPELSYYGRRVFLRNLDVGFTLVESERHQLNFVVTPSYDQMYFNRWDPLNFSFSGGPGGGGVSGGNFTSINISGIKQSTATDPLTPSAIPGEGKSPEFAVSGTVSVGARLEVNGALITSSTQLQGALGNIINIEIKDGVLSIKNVSTDDRVVLISDAAVELNDIRGNIASTATSVGGSNRINVTAEGGKFAVTPDNTVVPKAAQTKLAYDQVSQRRVSGLAGIEYSYFLPWMSLHLQALKDVTHVHNGQEFRAAAVFPWDLDSSKLALTLGANYKSQKVLDYYYGIDASDVSDTNLIYPIRNAGVEALVRVDWQKPLSKKWTLRARVQYLDLPSPITSSPLVAEDHVLSAFVGGVYHF